MVMKNDQTNEINSDKKEDMNRLLQLILILCVCLLASCAPSEPLPPSEYTQLLINIKDFFSMSLILLGQNNTFTFGQVISRIYYGHYHLVRLIFNNIKGYDGNNHTKVWKQMPADIRAYGEKLKDMRIKYDYMPMSFTQSEVLQDLEYIENHQNRFDAIIKELDRTVEIYSTNPFFSKEFNENIAEIKTTYKQISQRIAVVADELKNANTRN